MKWNSKNRRKYSLQYHLIFVCKYRKNLFIYKSIDRDIKKLSSEISSKHKVKIKYMETDKDHIHYMIETDVNINISNFIRTLKSYTTFHIWKRHSVVLSKYFWKENTFWTDGYFICSIGNVSEKQLQEYIKNQG